MSLTVAHKPHIHVPWLTIAVFVAAAVVAVAVLVLVNQPSEVTTETSAVVLTAPGAAVVPLPESPALRRAITEARPAPAPAPAPEEVVTPRHNLVIGTTLGRGDAGALPPAPDYAPGSVDDPHPLNHFAGTP